MEYAREVKAIKSGITEGFVEVLKYYKAWLAGGAITSIFTNREINDYDIYFPSKEALIRCLAAIYHEDRLYHKTDTSMLYEYRLVCVNISDKSISFLDTSTGAKIQLIYDRYYQTVEDIFESFDFTCCMGAYSFNDESIILHKDFLKHNSMRYLKFNPNTTYPLVSALRVDKYKQKGYTISKSQFLRVALSCSSLRITSWEESLKHIGGLYGKVPETLFDTKQEFTLENLIDQLGNINDSELPVHKQESLTFNDILEMVDTEVPEENSNTLLEGHYYKTVNKNLQSPIFSSNKIEYIEGSIVNGGKRGIYVDADPINKNKGYPFVVELAPVDENNEVVKDKPFSSEYRLLGDWRVSRVFPISLLPSNPKNRLYNKWIIKNED